MSRVCQGASYRAIQELREQDGYPILALCEIIGLPRSSYYKWRKRVPSASETRDKELIESMRILYLKSNGIFGYRRIQLHLQRHYNLRVNKKRVYRLMRIIGLQSVIRRTRPSYVKTTPEITAANILSRSFTAVQLNEKRLTDVTEFKCRDDRKLYLSAILDIKDKSIVSCCMSPSSSNRLVFETFDAAVRKYPDAHPLFHSDRGFQYTSKFFKAKLDAQGMTQSMSRVGRCIDNGPMEAFWGTLKVEMFCLRTFYDSEILKQAIEEYIKFYNNERFQERLGGLAPLEYRVWLETAA